MEYGRPTTNLEHIQHLEHILQDMNRPYMKDVTHLHGWQFFLLPPPFTLLDTGTTMANPNNAFPFVDLNGQVVLGNDTLRAILQDSDRNLTRSIREGRDRVASNARYLDRLHRLIQSEDLREAEVALLRQRRTAILADTADLRDRVRELEEYRRIVREARDHLDNNP